MIEESVLSEVLSVIGGQDHDPLASRATIPRREQGAQTLICAPDVLTIGLAEAGELGDI